MLVIVYFVISILDQIAKTRANNVPCACGCVRAYVRAGLARACLYVRLSVCLCMCISVSVWWSMCVCVNVRVSKPLYIGNRYLSTVKSIIYVFCIGILTVLEVYAEHFRIAQVEFNLLVATLCVIGKFITGTSVL